MGDERAGVGGDGSGWWKLVGAGEIGAGRFGQAVAVSGDGSVAAVGASLDHSGAGAVWVYAHTAAGLAMSGQKLTALDAAGPAMFGYSIAVANDGSRLVIGGPNDNGGTGAVWIFRRVGTEWIQQGPKLTPSNAIGEALFGASAATSGPSGNAIIVGAPGDNGSTGAAWAYTTKANGGLTQQGPKITASDETGAGRFGYGVALSGDGGTALLGGPYDGGARRSMDLHAHRKHVVPVRPTSDRKR